jgi:hypothetical protein
LKLSNAHREKDRVFVHMTITRVNNISEVWLSANENLDLLSKQINIWLTDNEIVGDHKKITNHIHVWEFSSHDDAVFLHLNWA